MEPIPLCVRVAAPLSELVALLLVVAVGGVGLYVAGLFLLHFYDAVSHNTEAPPNHAYWRAFWREWWCVTASLLSYPLGLFVPAAAQVYDPNGCPPVVFVHGYARNRACFFVLYWRLRRYGHKNLYPVNLLPTTASISTMGEQLAKKVEEISALCGGQRVIAVCHSMGGLAIRSCLLQRPETPVAKVITLGTPHAGTRTAYLAPGESCRQSRPGSAFLAEIKAELNVPTVCLYSKLDDVILPPVSAAWGNRVVAFDELGHLSLLYSVEVCDIVLHELT
jgi:triacylglycerol esterase/lipase EstA (alpha/beta hydrolase family)